MSKEEKDQINPLKINKETLSQLDDEQLRQIAGGAMGGSPDDPDEEETCTDLGSCSSCCNSGGPA